MKIILLILLIHFIADFLCQTDKMAINKSKSLYWLSVHVATYTAVLLIGSMLAFTAFPVKAVLLFVGINGLAHFVTDFFTSKVTSHFWQRESKHWFFVAVGFDQLIHYSCLLISYQYIIVKGWGI